MRVRGDSARNRANMISCGISEAKLAATKNYGWHITEQVKGIKLMEMADFGGIHCERIFAISRSSTKLDI
jgi:hypothetical protein